MLKRFAIVAAALSVFSIVAIGGRYLRLNSQSDDASGTSSQYSLKASWAESSINTLDEEQAKEFSEDRRRKKRVLQFEVKENKASAERYSGYASDYADAADNWLLALEITVGALAALWLIVPWIITGKIPFPRSPQAKG